MEWFYYVGVVLLAAVVLVHTSKKRNERGPPSWPLIGALPSHASNLPRFHDYVTHYCRLYTTFRVPYPTFDYYYTVLPANVEHMLKANFDNYVKGSFVYDKQQEFLGDGIFSVDGAEWKQQRKTASYEFASRALKDYSEVAFRDKAVTLATFLISEAQDGKQVNMQVLFSLSVNT
ncbi:hypothetical protein L7F22_024848 [Adiantum nelumboides]|nr:hypothetical protein [Adiantum nelumboides]